MRLHPCGMLFLSLACATAQPVLKAGEDEEMRTVVNLQRAAKLPWRDDGRCVVREAARSWPEVAERCFDALDLERLRFRDTAGRCAVSQAAVAAAPVARVVAICLIAQPELLVGVVIVVGVVVAAVLIQEALHQRELYTEEDVRRRVSRPLRQPSSSPEPRAWREPEHQPNQDFFPVDPSPEDPRRCLPCSPVPVGGTAYEHHSAAAGNDPHNGMENHTHHFRMQQSPPLAGCRCFWQRNFIDPTPDFSPLPGSVPVKPAGGGGIAP